MKPFLRFRLFLFLLLILTSISPASSLCFTPNGNLSNDVPCNPTASASVCCTAGFLCMSNGLCQPADWWADNSTQFIQGTCTDKSWVSEACGGYCVAVLPWLGLELGWAENISGGEWVMKCSNSSNPTWCCSAQDCCSDSDATKLQIGSAAVTATAGAHSTSTSTSTSTSSTTSSATASTATTTSSSSSSSTTTSSTTSSASTSTSPSSSSNNNNNDNSKSTITLALGLGLGLGIPLLILILAGGFFLRQRKQTINQTKLGYEGNGNGAYSTKELVTVQYAGSEPFPVSEVHAQDLRFQLHADDRPVEMQG